MALRIEFLAGLLGDVNESARAKYASMSKGRFDAKLAFIWSEVEAKMGIHMIKDVGCCLNSLAPEMKRNVLVMEHVASCLNQCAIFPFLICRFVQGSMVLLVLSGYSKHLEMMFFLH